MSLNADLIEATWPQDWGRLLRLARQVAGLSLSELSARAGLSKGYLSKLESGHITAQNPSRATLAALARALRASGRWRTLWSRARRLRRSTSAPNSLLQRSARTCVWTRTLCVWVGES